MAYQKPGPKNYLFSIHSSLSPNIHCCGNILPALLQCSTSTFFPSFFASIQRTLTSSQIVITYSNPLKYFCLSPNFLIIFRDSKKTV